MKTQVINLKHGGKVLFNRQKEIEGIDLQFIFNAGAFNDGKNKLGIAHFLEHAMCGFPNAKMTREQRDSYRRKFSYFNARTSFREMAFIVRMTEEDFEDAVDFITESFSSIKLTQEEFDKEYKIIENEIKTRVKKNANELSVTVRTEIIKDEHFKNAITSPAGTETTLANITLQDLVDFKNNYLTLNNLTVCVCGNISQKRVKNAMHKFVETRIGSSSVQGFLPKEVNTIFAPKFHYKKAVEEGKAIITCLYNLKHIPWSYEVPREFSIGDMLSMVLNEYAFKFFREQKNLCYSCSMGICSIANYFSNEFYLECQESCLDKVIECYKEFLDSLPKDIDRAMFEKHKRKRILQYDFDFISIGRISDIMYSVYTGENKLYTTKYRKKLLEKRKGISYEEVNDLYKTIFNAKPHITIVANDEKYKDFDYKSFAKLARKK